MASDNDMFQSSKLSVTQWHKRWKSPTSDDNGKRGKSLLGLDRPYQKDNNSRDDAQQHQQQRKNYRRQHEETPSYSGGVDRDAISRADDDERRERDKRWRTTGAGDRDDRRYNDNKYRGGDNHVGDSRSRRRYYDDDNGDDRHYNKRRRREDNRYSSSSSYRDRDRDRDRSGYRDMSSFNNDNRQQHGDSRQRDNRRRDRNASPRSQNYDIDDQSSSQRRNNSQRRRGNQSTSTSSREVETKQPIFQPKSNLYYSSSSSLPVANNFASAHQTHSSSSSRRDRGSRIPRMSECRTLEEALNATYDNLDRLSPRDVSAFWTVVPKFLDERGRRNQSSRNEKRDDQMNQHMFNQFKTISIKSMKEIERYGYRDLATTAISLAKIMDRVSKRGKRKGSTEQILQEVFTGNSSQNKEFIFNKLAAASMPILHEFEPQHLSNTLWAYANVGVTHTELFKEAGDAIIAIEQLDEFWPQALSNIVWAYATLSEKNPKLFKKVADHVVTLGNLDRFNSQALSNIVWAYANAGVSHPNLFQTVADHIVTLDLRKFIGQDFSNIVWAYATAGEPNSKLFQKIADLIVGLDGLDRFKSQEISNIVWAYAKAGEPHSKLFQTVADHIVTLDLRKFIGQDYSNTVWAYATVGQSHPELFKKLADAAIKRQQEFKPQHIANFLWAFATNGVIDHHLFSAFVPSVKENLDKYMAQHLSNIAWAYSVTNIATPTVFNDKFVEACLKKEDELITDGLSQLHQWQLWQEELQSNVQLPQSLKTKCYDAFIKADPRPSKLQDDVISELSSAGLQPQEEVLTKSGYRLDAVVEVNGKQVGVEVDGPSHFIGRELTGSTILKHRQVTNLDGISLISVPYWEWDKLKNDSKKKQQYLRTLLKLG